MANLYEVSTDFILGNNSTKSNDYGVLLTPSEIELLTAYRAITDAGKLALLSSARGIAAQFSSEIPFEFKD